jgi:hypothetical protein
LTQIGLEGVALLQTHDVERSRVDNLVRRASRPVQALRAVPHGGTWAGMVLAGIGVALIAIAWGRTAGVSDVALQVPYVISFGFTGLGLVVVGLTVAGVAAKQEDARERSRQLTELRELLSELRRSVEEDGP